MAAMAVAFVTCALATQLALTRSEWKAARERYAVKTKKAALLLKNADPRLSWSATKIARALREGQFTSVEITLAYIKHLELINLYTNSMVGSRFDRALLEAREADAKLERFRRTGEPVGEFCGVPLFSKEVFEQPGMPYTAGVFALSQRRGKDTCFALGKAIRDGGVIVLGNGNTSEQCMWMESSNPVHGRTNNVYSAGRTVGGSSGGTAATISALGAAFAITSDVGGSTRIPSLYNGLFGVKPTGGSVSNNGTTPKAIGRGNWFCQLGPCSRHSEDLLPLLRIIAGPADKDPAYENFQTKPDMAKKWTSDQVPLKTLRVYDSRRQPGSFGPLGLFQNRREAAMIRAHDEVAKYLQSQAAGFTEVDIRELEEGFDIWGAMVGEATKKRPFRQVLAEGKPGAGSVLWAYKELFKYLLTGGYLSDHTLPGVALAALEFLESLNPWKNARLIKKGEKLRAHISELLGEDGVMIVPSLPTPAPHHGNQFLLRASESGATGLINVLEFPSCAVPLGLDETGLPLGVQIIANHGNDHLCISVARALEQAGIARWVPPVVVSAEDE